MDAIPDRKTFFRRDATGSPTWQSWPFPRIGAEPAPQRPRSCLLVGFWGVPNFGDEWLLRCAQAFARDWLPHNRPTVMVHSSEIERRLGQHRAGVRMLDGFFPDPRFFRSLPSLIAELGRSDITLIGGGGLINDRYTAASIPRYAVPALMSIVRGVPVLWWGLGVAAPRGRLLRRLAFATLRLSTRVLVRDRDSQRQLRAEGVLAQLSDDLSVLSPPSPDPRAGAFERVLVVNFRDDDPALAAGRLGYVAASRRHFDRIVLLAAEPGDEALYRTLMAALDPSPPGAGIEIVRASDYAGIQRELSGAALVVSERLHVSLFALGAGAPTIVLSYEGKVDAVVGRLYPQARITLRDAFWRDEGVRLAAVPSTGTVAAVSPASLAAQLASELAAAIETRPAPSDRLLAALWLGALLPMGAAVAAAIWAKRALRRAAADRPYEPTATTFAIDGTPATSIANRR